MIINVPLAAYGTMGKVFRTVGLAWVTTRLGPVGVHRQLDVNESLAGLRLRWLGQEPVDAIHS